LRVENATTSFVVAIPCIIIPCGRSTFTGVSALGKEVADRRTGEQVAGRRIGEQVAGRRSGEQATDRRMRTDRIHAL
jgi:hypothetical protein